MDGGDQLSTAIVLGIVLAVGLALFLFLAWFVRGTWRWLTGGGKRIGSAPRQESRFEPVKPINGAGVSASDLFVVRSNLNAVARQVEDLERRLRLASFEGAKAEASSRH